MAIDDTSIIDFVSIDHDKEVLLTIVDHWTWEDERGHLLALQEKINTYCHYIESGQLYDDYALARDGHPIIGIRFFNEPPKDTLAWFESVKELVLAEGVGFEWEVTNHQI